MFLHCALLTMHCVIISACTHSDLSECNVHCVTVAISLLVADDAGCGMIQNDLFAVVSVW